MELDRFVNVALSGPVFDQYTPIIGGDAFDHDHGLPRWLPAHHRRRIKAYQVLDRLYQNMDAGIEVQEDMKRIRFGLVEYVVGVFRDLTVGGEQRIVVKGAADEDGDKSLAAEQDLLSDWADLNLFYPKLQEAERQAVLLGDAFFRLRLGKNAGVDDVQVDVIHPMFCFPDFDRNGAITRMVFVWEEYQALIPGGMDILSIYKDVYEFGDNGNVIETAGWYQYTLVPTLSDLEIEKYDKTDDGVEINKLDLGIKVMPIFHLANSWTGFDYGVSDLAYNLDEVQEVNAVDTDTSAAARLLGIPPLVVSGLQQRVKAGVEKEDESLSVGPGQILNVDTNGRADYLDNTNLLKTAFEWSDRVEDKFFRHMRLGKLFQGKTDNIRDIESAKAFKTLMATLYARVAQKRTVRKSFYIKLLAGLRQMLLVAQPGTPFSKAPLSLSFGNILPLDNSDDLTVISAAWGLGKGFISARTAAKLGAAAGTGVVDFDKEAEDILGQLALGGKQALDGTNADGTLKTQAAPAAGATPAPESKSFSLKKKTPPVKK